jgi:polyisoprenyl-phosphate glycosyltransferase
MMDNGPGNGLAAIQRKLITISIPVFNESANIPRLIERVCQLASSLPNYDFEFLFTDNCSSDDTFQRLSEAAESDPRIRALRFSRNFGFQRSILTNYLEARGDAAVQLDADLQDPPELIAQFLQHWEKGYKVVYGIRRRRQEGALITGTRRLFYRFITYLSEVPLPLDAGDFRLIDRCIIEHLRASRDQSPYLRGMIPMLGYPQVGIPYDREARKAGETKFRLSALVRLAIDGITSQSTKPLQLISVFGVVLCLLSFILVAIYLGLWLGDAVDAPPGFMTLVLLIFFSIGLNALFLGILGEYLGRVFRNVRNMPLTIVQERVEVQPPSVRPGTIEPMREKRHA